MAYQLSLQKDGRFDAYESASLFAASDEDAAQKAKDWTHSFGSTHENARLLVVMSGKGIATMRPGEFNASRQMKRPPLGLVNDGSLVESRGAY